MKHFWTIQYLHCNENTTAFNRYFTSKKKALEHLEIISDTWKMDIRAENLLNDKNFLTIVSDGLMLVSFENPYTEAQDCYPAFLKRIKFDN